MQLFQTRGSTILLIAFFPYVKDACTLIASLRQSKKVAAVIVSKNFMAILSDSSQARKTNNETVRTVCEDIHIYVVVSLLETCERGGTDADSIKEAID